VELNSGDLDNDGDLDNNDILGLKAIAVDVQRDIQRGTLLSATEEREENYFKELDGLGYSEVVSLADLSTAAIEEYRAAQQRSIEKGRCTFVAVGSYSPYSASRAAKNTCEQVPQRKAPRRY
jgi:hypothetical protein